MGFGTLLKKHEKLMHLGQYIKRKKAKKIRQEVIVDIKIKTKPKKD